jgi:hypothetical protein
MPTNSSIWSPRVFQRRNPTSDGSTNQSASPNAPGPIINVAPSAGWQQVPVPGHPWHDRPQHQHQHGIPTMSRANTSGSNVASSVEQQQADISRNNWADQQYNQPGHRAPSTRDGSMQQLTTLDTPGAGVVRSAEQHQKYIGRHILSVKEMQQIEREYDEEEEQTLAMVAAQDPGRARIGQQ